jgi:hypothetical protein
MSENQKTFQERIIEILTNTIFNEMYTDEDEEGFKERQGDFKELAVLASCEIIDVLVEINKKYDDKEKQILEAMDKLINNHQIKNS